MGYGDEIIAAGQAQALFDSTGQPSVIVDHRGRPRWHPIWDGNPAIVHPDAANTRDGYWTVVNGPNCRPYIVYPFTPESGWTFNKTFRARKHVAKIYLTDAEIDFGLRVRKRYGPYVLIEPWSKHANLRWPMRKWTELVRQLSGRVTFVQHIHAGTTEIVEGVQVERATFREACGLVQYARIYIRGESGMLHACAALGCRSIALWGGCMDWDVLGGYPGEIGLGVSDPCGSWKPCDHCTECMNAISVEDVVGALVEVGIE